jgi:hypothetical protein
MPEDIQIGDLVEIKATGVRLFVVEFSTDFDGSRFYCLCHYRHDTNQGKPYCIPAFMNQAMNEGWIGGYCRLDLEIIKTD